MIFVDWRHTNTVALAHGCLREWFDCIMVMLQVYGTTLRVTRWTTADQWQYVQYESKTMKAKEDAEWTSAAYFSNCLSTPERVHNRNKPVPGYQMDLWCFSASRRYLTWALSLPLTALKFVGSMLWSNPKFPVSFISSTKRAPISGCMAGWAERVTVLQLFTVYEHRNIHLNVTSPLSGVGQTVHTWLSWSTRPRCQHNHDHCKLRNERLRLYLGYEF